MRHLDESTLRRLAEHRPAAGPVLSVYVDLDPSTFATPEARDSQITSLVNEAERAMDGRRASHDEREQMRRSIDRARAMLTDARSDVMRGARGVAIFCADGDVLEVVPIRDTVERRVVFGEAPYVEPLASLITPDGWVVLCVNRRAARILRGSAQRLRELDAFADTVHRQHDQGGWSQARYQRSVEQDVQNHLKHAAQALYDHWRHEPFDHLVVAAPQELWPEVESALHADLRKRFVERIHVDVEHSSLDDIQAELGHVVERYERARDAELLERVVADHTREGRAAVGPAETLDALNDRRVSHLLYREGVAVPGAVCPECGWLRPAPEACPVDGTRMVARENVIDDAIKAALAQAAEIRPIKAPNADAIDTVAALLRF